MKKKIDIKIKGETMQLCYTISRMDAFEKAIQAKDKNETLLSMVMLFNDITKTDLEFLVQGLIYGLEKDGARVSSLMSNASKPKREIFLDFVDVYCSIEGNSLQSLTGLILKALQVTGLFTMGAAAPVTEPVNVVQEAPQQEQITNQE